MTSKNSECDGTSVPAFSYYSSDNNPSRSSSSCSSGNGNGSDSCRDVAMEGTDRVDIGQVIVRFNTYLQARQCQRLVTSAGQNRRRLVSDRHRPKYRSVMLSSEVVIIIIMYIYHALIDAQSAHMIHFKLNAVLCTHVVQSPTQVT